MPENTTPNQNNENLSASDHGAAQPTVQPAAASTTPPQPQQPHPAAANASTSHTSKKTEKVKKSDTSDKTPFLRRTWVRVAGAILAALLLLGIGFGAGWAASSASGPDFDGPGDSEMWDDRDDMPGRPGDHSDDSDRGPHGGPQRGYPGEMTPDDNESGDVTPDDDQTDEPTPQDDESDEPTPEVTPGTPSNS